MGRETGRCQIHLVEELSPFIAGLDKIHTFGTMLRGEGALKDSSE